MFLFGKPALWSFLMVLLLAACSFTDQPEQVSEEQGKVVTNELRTVLVPWKQLPEDEIDGVSRVVFDGANGAYVLNGNSKDVSVFDENGDFVRRIGKEGEGPGELSRPYHLLIDEGEVWVTDLSKNASVVFKTDGTFLREENLEKIFYHMVRFKGVTYYSWFHREGEPDITGHDAEGNIVLALHLKNANDETHGTTFDIDDQGRIYAVATQDYQIEIYEPDGTYVETLKQYWEPTPPIQVPSRSYFASVEAVTKIQVYNNRIYVLLGCNQLYYEKLSKKTLGPEYHTRIEVLGLDGTFQKRVWEPSLGLKTNGLRHYVTFGLDHQERLWVQSLDDRTKVMIYQPISF